MPTSVHLRAAGASDVGRKRKENEDRIFFDAERGIFLVVDGLGGHAAGERAAEIAIEIITARLSRHTGSPEQRVREAFALASSEIYEEAQRHPEYAGMACVATLAVVEEEGAIIGHVGDSRCYLLEPGSIRKVTHDHSPVGELEDSGNLSEAEAMRHPRRNEVFRDLGNGLHAPDDADFVEIVRVALPEQSALLLCSDGLSDQVTSEEVRDIVEKNGADLDRAIYDLINAANGKGGKDNVSVVLVATPAYAARASHIPREDTKRTERRTSGVLWFLAGVLITVTAIWLASHWRAKQVQVQSARSPQTIAVPAGSSLLEAMEAARAGDTVVLSAGQYPVKLALKEGVTVRSETLLGAKISGITCVNVKGARVSGFEIAGSSVGVAIDSCEAELSNLKITGASDAGVDISGDGRTVLQASTIAENSGIGVRIHGTAAPALLHNLITNNGHGATPLPGISIQGSANPELTGNVITKSGAEAIWASPLYKTDRLTQENIVAPELRNRRKLIKVVTR